MVIHDARTPVIRVAAPDRDGAAAYERVRDRLQGFRRVG